LVKIKIIYNKIRGSISKGERKFLAGGT